VVSASSSAPNLLAHAGFRRARLPQESLPGELEQAVRSMVERTPLYQSRFPLLAEPLAWASFEQIPLLTKQEIAERGHCAFFPNCSEVDRKVLERSYESETTSGTTAAPMTVIMEEGWWDQQTRRAYRAHPVLAPFADRPFRKAVLAPVNCSSNLCPYEDFPFPHRFFDGTIYLNLSSDPFCFTEAEWDRIVTELQAVKPEILEGEPVYLSLLARACLQRQVVVPSIRAVILTYAKGGRIHGDRIAEAFPAPQVDLYGSTEAGYLFVGDAFAGNSIPVEANALIELQELAPARSDAFRVIATTLNRQAMPLLRYATGDVVRQEGNGFRVLGRERDLTLTAEGHLLSAADFDPLFPTDFVCWHYCLTQESPTRWSFDYVADGRCPQQLEADLADLLGARVRSTRRKRLAPSASGKFSPFKPLQATGKS
jgi:phenylacetate-CoA ligase